MEDYKCVCEFACLCGVLLVCAYCLVNVDVCLYGISLFGYLVCICLSVTVRSYITPTKWKALASLQHALQQQRTAAGMSLGYLTLRTSFYFFPSSSPLLTPSLFIFSLMPVSPMACFLKSLLELFQNCHILLHCRLLYVWHSSRNVLICVGMSWGVYSCVCVLVACVPQLSTCSACHVSRGNEDGLD